MQRKTHYCEKSPEHMASWLPKNTGEYRGGFLITITLPFYSMALLLAGVFPNLSLILSPTRVAFLDLLSSLCKLTKFASLKPSTFGKKKEGNSSESYYKLLST